VGQARENLKCFDADKSSLFHFLNMSKVSPSMTPILLYGLDLPYTSFSPSAHRNFMLKQLSSQNGTEFKFIDAPVFIHTHAVVRKGKDQYGKYCFGIMPDESEFVRVVETSVLDNLDGVIAVAEPTLNVPNLPRKSLTYENLLNLKITRTVGQNLEGNIVAYEEHDDVLKVGQKLLMTVEIHGLYHSSQWKGALARIKSYRAVETF